MPQPKILTRLVSQIIAQGKAPADANRIAISALQKSGNLKPGTIEATAKGVRRGEMSPAQRAIDRAIKARGGRPADYVYRASTNRATRKR